MSSHHYTPHSPVRQGHLFRSNSSRTEPRPSRSILRDCHNIDSSPTKSSFRSDFRQLGRSATNNFEHNDYVIDNNNRLSSSIQPNVIGFKIAHDEQNEQIEPQLSYSQLPTAVQDLQKLVLKLAKNHQTDMRKMQLQIDRQEILLRNLLGDPRRRGLDLT